jgi:hypothetical protein
MELALRRILLADSYTIGRLFSDDVDLDIYTLEDKVREIPELPVEQWKIYGQTAIPRGRYQVNPVWFGRYARLMPELQDVPGFTEIFIHPGATDKNTAGCLLVSKKWEGGDLLEASWEALDELWPLMTAVWDSGNEVWITVEDAQ